MVGLIVGFTIFTLAFSFAHLMESFDRDFSQADRSDLTVQFILENTGYALIALTVALLAAFDLFAFIQQLSGLDLQYGNMLDWKLLSGLIFVALLMGLIFRLYPILLFSGSLKTSRSPGPLRWPHQLLDSEKRWLPSSSQQ